MVATTDRRNDRAENNTNVKRETVPLRTLLLSTAVKGKTYAVSSSTGWARGPDSTVGRTFGERISRTVRGDGGHGRTDAANRRVLSNRKFLNEPVELATAMNEIENLFCLHNYWLDIAFARLYLRPTDTVGGCETHSSGIRLANTGAAPAADKR